MDDLSGLDWSSTASNIKASRPPGANYSSSPSLYSSLQPKPSSQIPGFSSGAPFPAVKSGASTPLRHASPTPSAPPKDHDSFKSLVTFGSWKSNCAGPSLRERQEQLEAERRRKEAEKQKQAQVQFGDARFWDSLGQSPSPAPAAHTLTPPSATVPNGKHTESDDDLFAAFDSATVVDNASHYPPPPKTSSPSTLSAASNGLDLTNPSAWSQPAAAKVGELGDDDDDPFGLNVLGQPSNSAPPPSGQARPIGDDEDDLLGDLAKPVEEVKEKQRALRQAEEAERLARRQSPNAGREEATGGWTVDPFDRAVAQLVEYGFTPENARRGLIESGTGVDVQAAVNWLLDDAHFQAKQKAQGRNSSVGSSRHASQPRGDVLGDRTTHGDGRSLTGNEPDFSKAAAAMGSKLFKTANSLWKTGQKQVQKAVADFQADTGGVDPNMPRWMRPAQKDMVGSSRKTESTSSVTGEAMMLESGAPPERKGVQNTSKFWPPSQASSSPAPSSVISSSSSQANSLPKWQKASQPSPMDSRPRLSKQAVEEQSSQAYVSPARRRKAQGQPTPQSTSEDLLVESSNGLAVAPTRVAHRPAQPPPQPNVSWVASEPRQPPRPKSPSRSARQIPPLSAAAHEASTRQRLEGTAHFKRGDYAAAHESYTNSLSAVPPSHPLAILLLCNRTLTALKTGQPRLAIEDADVALDIIGLGKGVGEQVDLGPPDHEKREIHDLYGKALTRKAKALEQMEKWADASAVWQLCVESGLGGATVTAGRQRCQKALAPKPAAPPPRKIAAKPRPAPAAASTLLQQGDSEAVQRLRAANAAAEKEGDEKFALTDQVDARIAAWRDNKRDNLRALLGSLQNVLWRGSGWKHVGLHELLVANKVKVAYMKAIAKTHPDKLPQDASLEIRMVAGSVFSTLNEAWDKFKAENGL